MCEQQCNFEDVSQLFTLPLDDAVFFKFLGDNLDHKRRVHDERSDNQGSMVHMYSTLVGRSHTPAVELSRKGQVAPLESFPSISFLPTASDVQAVKQNLVVLGSHLHIHPHSPLCKSVPKHIPHKSEVVVIDVLMKNEAKHSNMLDIMFKMQEYLGKDYPSE